MGKTEKPESDEDQELDLGESKVDQEPRQHVPYILNGELYRIESQIGDNVTVKCCYCPPDRIYRGSVRSTGNFHMHIKRRHASLLGKLHEMKVAALVERRDRIMKNRRTAKSRKKSTSSTGISTLTAVSAASSVEEPKSTATHELKIKTVFQRHKQEHHEQEEATAIQTSISISDSSMDNNSQSSDKLSIMGLKQYNPNNNNTNVAVNYNNFQDSYNASSVNSGTTTTFEANPKNGASDIHLPTIVSMPRMLSFNAIKPEQQQQMLNDQPEAIDLSRSSSIHSADLQPGVFTQTVQNVQFGISRAPDFPAFVNGSPRKILMHIDNTLADIKDEMQARNQIEQKRLLFDIAKFQFLHPNFNFESSQ